MIALLPLLPPLLWAPDVTGVEVESREVVADGAEFGEVGAYERIVGTIRFAFDPANEHNAAIVDLDLAPRNEDGLVEAWGDLVVLRPVEPEKGSGTALLEVSNRGGKASLSYFNRAGRGPTGGGEFGDGFLMRRGLTVIWVGWQWDVPEDPSRLRLHVPVATGPAGPLEGLVRADWVVTEPTTTLAIGHRNHVPYHTVDHRHPDNVLTERDGRLAPRRVIPRDEWHFMREHGDMIVSSLEHVWRDHDDDTPGFEPGKIYELVYRAKDPRVVGLGLAAIRDTIAYAKYDEDAPFRVERGMAVGISQTGRFLRHFLYQGFNTDEEGRRAFDGILAHTAGAGRGSFNHRFAQPSRDAHRYSAFFYPTDIFPFSGRTQRDPLTGMRDGLFARQAESGNLPKVFYTNTGYEYWGRAASLLHTSLDGSADVEPLPNERIYHLASGQHFVARFPPRDGDRLEGTDLRRGNPLDFLVTERALLAALQDWVEDDREPPPSRYPRIADGTLVPIDEVDFPDLPGVDFPTVVHEAYRADYGPDFRTRGVVSIQPPVLGPGFPSLVPQVDAFGNERGGVPSVEILVPLATYAPWSLRWGEPGEEHELYDFYGTLIPFPATLEARAERGDPRPSVDVIHADVETYLDAVGAAATQLVEQRFLLEEDRERVVARARALWDWVTTR